MSTHSSEATTEDGGIKDRVLALPTISSQTLLVGSAFVAAMLIVVLVYVFRRRSTAHRSEVLIIGPSDAGKTTILTSLVFNQALPTHTSLQPNSSVITTAESKRQHWIVDIPGHPRIRDQFKEHLPSAKAVVFVVDSSTVTRNGSSVAEFLHHVLNALTSLPPTVSLPPLLILAHKSDLLTLPSSTSTSTNSPSQARSTLAIARVRTILERELEKRRVAQRGGVAVEGLGAEGGQEDGMGEEGMGGLECRSGPGGDGSFRFAEWEAGEVAFLGTWVKVGAGGAVGLDEKGEKGDGEVGDGLDEMREWLEELE